LQPCDYGTFADVVWLFIIEFKSYNKSFRKMAKAAFRFSKEKKNSEGKLGLVMCTALVIGNMIGSGIYLLPSSLARYGGISILGWLFTTAGAVVLAMVFARLSRLVSRSGGPYAFVHQGFGEFAGFLVAWGYWISIWTGNAAISVAMVGYLTTFLPALNSNPMWQIFTALSAIWILTLINVMGVRKAGLIQVVTTVLKLIPIVTIAFAGLFYLKMDHFSPFNRSGSSSFFAITATASLTLWAFLGLESASVPADDVQDPKRTIPRATIIGTIITAVVYVLGTTAVIGILPPELAEKSSAPFADAAGVIWGGWAGYFIAAGAAISCFGALNGWILLQGQMPRAIAIDGLFPKIFKTTSKHRTPLFGLIFSSILVSILMAMNFTKSLVEQFTFIIMLATLACLIPYILCSLSELMIYFKRREKLNKRRLFSSTILAIFAFLYSFWALAGLGREIVYWGFLLLIAGIPVFCVVKKRDVKVD